MNQEVGTKLQAYLDGELTGREMQQVAALIETDAEARARAEDREPAFEELVGVARG